MDFKNVFLALALVLVGIIAYFGLANDFNTQYGTTLGYDMNVTRDRVQTMLEGNLTEISGEAGNATTAQEGASLGSGDTGLVARSLKVIGKLPVMLGLIPALMRDGAAVIGIPENIADVAVWSFMIAFAIVFAYILLIGAKRLL